MGSQDLQARVIEHEWCAALTAEERMRAFSCDGTAGVADSPSPDRAARLAQWLEKRRILRPTYLVDTNCSDAELLRILATAYEPDVLAQGPSFDWLYRLSEAATFDPSTELEPSDFASFVAPFVGWAVEKLNARLAALATEATRFVIPISLLMHSFADKLKGKLIWMSYRVLVLELNVARLQGQLEGASPQQRYCSFVKLLRDSGFRSRLLREYPVLARQLSEYAAMWLEGASEFAERLYSDWNELKKRFPEIEQAGEIETLSLEQGDSHRRGRSVTIVNFKSGARIVYKPRSMSLDVHFQQLLTWLNGQGISLPFRTISIWDRGAYGWSEFVPFAPCSTIEEIKRFYKRQGAYLALLYVLEATDFHAHNLIACCEHPMLVDLEGLLHPRYKPADQSSAAQLGNWAMGKSVIRVGMLPRNSLSSPDGGGLDLSGLGGEPGQAYPMRVPSWEGIGTDEMRYTEESRLYSGGENRPKLGGEHVQTSDYAKEIVEGFVEMYRLLKQHRSSLLEASGPLAPFASDETRVLMRGTMIYEQILGYSNHPDLLRDMLDSEAYLDCLWASTDEDRGLAICINSEQAALSRRDIPFFSARPGSHSLWTGEGNLIENFFDESSIEAVSHRLANLSEDDLRSQVWYINSALSLSTMNDHAVHKQGLHRTYPRSSPTGSELVQHACKIADHLIEIAIKTPEHVTWIGFSLMNECQWTLRPIGLDLYSGLPGLALFFAYLGAVTNRERYSDFARYVVCTLLYTVQQTETNSDGRAIGVFNGLGSYIYVLSHLAALWKDAALLDQAERTMEEIGPLIDGDREFDLVNGSAGCIGALAALNSVRPSERAKNLVERCASHLVNSAMEAKTGLAWSTRIKSDQPLTGFSHGVAGIAWALIEAGVISGNDRYRGTARQALEYERACFSPTEQNWPDFRPSPLRPNGKASNGQPTYCALWCHGSGGIGLSRALMLRHWDEAFLYDETAIAARTTLKWGFGRNYSLCHGDAGNLDILLMISMITHDRRLHDKTYKVAGRFVDGLDRYGWLCGTPNWVETPGLMAGLAGIGYGLLRLAEPEKVPSIIAIEKPI